MCPLGGGRECGGGLDGGSRRSVRAKREQKKSPVVVRQPGTLRTAATYAPHWWVSTIGDGELNFSVRNRKRWILTAITTAVSYLREKTSEIVSPLQINFKSFALLALPLSNFSAIFPLGKSLGPLVQVS